MDTYQSRFHREWGDLKDPHVRSLAWLLTSPDILDKDAPMWWHQIGALEFPERAVLRKWLVSLDQHPSVLHEALKVHRFLRLGHYAENLLAYYFTHEGLLSGHGVQVHNERNETIGEFDYLLFAPGGLLHLELATKFYLFHPAPNSGRARSVFDYLGPNLNDTLGAKMQKILQRQLMLSQHESAQKLIGAKVIAAKAIIKGWLFYRSQERDQFSIPGIANNHCLGFWWTMSELEKLAIPYAIRLERLQWLAPAQTEVDEVLEKGMLIESLHRHFHIETTPILIAIMKKNGDVMQEFCRGMVVPDSWVEKANHLSL